MQLTPHPKITKERKFKPLNLPTPHFQMPYCFFPTKLFKKGIRVPTMPFSFFYPQKNLAILKVSLLPKKGAPTTRQKGRIEDAIKPLLCHSGEDRFESANYDTVRKMTFKMCALWRYNSWRLGNRNCCSGKVRGLHEGTTEEYGDGGTFFRYLLILQWGMGKGWDFEMFCGMMITCWRCGLSRDLWYLETEKAK